MIQLTDGNVGSPSLQFALETNTGIYRVGLGQFGITVLGNLMLEVNSTGIRSPGTGNFAGGISGGVF